MAYQDVGGVVCEQTLAGWHSRVVLTCRAAEGGPKGKVLGMCTMSTGLEAGENGLLQVLCQGYKTSSNVAHLILHMCCCASWGMPAVLQETTQGARKGQC